MNSCRAAARRPFPGADMTFLKTTMAALLAAVLLAAPAAALEIGGTYRVKGTNFNGGEYRGTARIVVTSQNTCRIYWKIGADSAEGICMRNGGSFSAAYSMGGQVGLVIYQIKLDGSMQGLWTVADQKGVGTEVLTPQ